MGNCLEKQSIHLLRRVTVLFLLIWLNKCAVEIKNNLSSSKGFSGPVITEQQPKKPTKNIDNDGDEPPVRNYRFKVNNAPNKTSIVVYGNQPSKSLDSDRKGGLNHRMTSNISFRGEQLTWFVGSMQMPDKDLKITGTNSLMSTNNQSDSRTPTYYKYLNPGQSGPVR